MRMNNLDSRLCAQPINLPASDKSDKSLTVQIPMAESNTTCTQALVIPGMNSRIADGCAFAQVLKPERAECK